MATIRLWFAACTRQRHVIASLLTRPSRKPKTCPANSVVATLAPPTTTRDSASLSSKRARERHRDRTLAAFEVCLPSAKISFTDSEKRTARHDVIRQQLLPSVRSQQSTQSLYLCEIDTCSWATFH